MMKWIIPSLTLVVLGAWAYYQSDHLYTAATKERAVFYTRPVATQQWWADMIGRMEDRADWWRLTAWVTPPLGVAWAALGYHMRSAGRASRGSPSLDPTTRGDLPCTAQGNGVRNSG